MQNKRSYILDTNVILHNANAIFYYTNSKIIIPLCVINKLDDFKSLINSIGKNARLFLERIEELQKKGDLLKGITLENDSEIFIYPHPTEHSKLPQYFNLGKTANQVLVACLSLQEENTDFSLISNDNNLRIKAKILGIDVSPFDNKDIQIEELYEPIEEIKLTQLQWQELDATDAIDFQSKDSFDNKYYCAVNQKNKVYLLRYWGKKQKLRRKECPSFVWNITARNQEQKAAIDLLLDPSIKIAFLAGKAGTGKTLLAMAAAIDGLLNTKSYHKILVARPFIPMGRDVGYLPGDIMEKLTPWMQPLLDTLEFITTCSTQKKSFSYTDLIDKKLIELEALTYIRGRSIPNRFILIDEAQNLTPHEIKTIITRVGENSKIVFTGDPYQIDNPFVDTYSNGLSYVMDRMKNSSLAGHIFLVKGERSELAELASNLL